MKKKTIIIAVAVVAAIGIAAAFYLIRRNVSEHVEELGDEHQTAGVYDYAVEPADPYIVGLWQEASNPQWYKAYYDDAAEDGFYWGKEWQENDDVFEEDLAYHGNGWFKWKREKNELIELHVMTMSKAVVPKRWNITIKKNKMSDSRGIKLVADSIIFSEKEFSANKYRFGRIER